MATIEVSNADELLAAFTAAKNSSTTIQLTTDIDMNDNIQTSSIQIVTGGYTITITGLHDTNQKYSIKNLQSNASSLFIASTSNSVYFNYINFTNIYCLGISNFARGIIFNHCEFYGLFQSTTGFSFGYQPGSSDYFNKYNYCSFTIVNSNLIYGGISAANISYCYIKYISCRNIQNATTTTYSNTLTNTFFTGTLTDNSETSMILSSNAPQYCIFNISLTSTSTAKSYCKTPTSICLQNSTLAGDVTLSTGNTLVSLTDTQMKNFDAVSATGFPVVNYTES